MELTDVRDALVTIDTKVPVFHHEAKGKHNKYIVWAEDGEGDSLSANNVKVMQGIEGTIDYYTKEEYDGNFTKIQEVLNTNKIAWRLGSIQHEKDTGFIHYEWIWRII